MRALVLPILVPMATAALMLVAPRRPGLQRWMGVAGAVGLLISAIVVFVRVEQEGIQVLQVGGWQAPFGITLVADLLAALLLLAVGIVAVAVTGAAFAGVDPKREAIGYHPLIQILLMGVAGAFLTGDFFNLYVWFEVMLVASFVLMALHRNRAQLDASFKYVAINLVASSIFLTALGLLYGVTGTLNMADVARVWPAVRTIGLDVVLAVLFATAFSIKAGLFPLFFWLPASYHTPPAAVGAVFAGLLTKVGVYALFRVFTLLFVDGPSQLMTMLLTMSVGTMVIGLIAPRLWRSAHSFRASGPSPALDQSIFVPTLSPAIDDCSSVDTCACPQERGSMHDIFANTHMHGKWSNINDIVIEPAHSGDVSAILELLSNRALPTAGLADHLETTLVARNGTQVVGSIAIEEYADGGLLRSVAVAAALQGQGLGRSLTDAALALAKERGLRTLYLLTTTAERYFPKFGFEQIQRDDVPASIRQSVEFTSACPSSAIVMRNRL